MDVLEHSKRYTSIRIYTCSRVLDEFSPINIATTVMLEIDYVQVALISVLVYLYCGYILYIVICTSLRIVLLLCSQSSKPKR
jgi:hypothetical protein